MRDFRLDFARRPFRDERPVYLAVAITVVLSVALLTANVRLYRGFHREMEGTSRQIQFLEQKLARTTREIEQTRTALNGYKIASLARESQGLLQVVSARRFSWTALLARLERTLPADVRVARLEPRFEETGQVTLDLSLVGKNPDSVVTTIAALSRDPAFSTIELKSEASPEQGVPEGHSFALSARYQPEDRS